MQTRSSGRNRADLITRYAGSMLFVYVHIAISTVWMLLLEKNPWPRRPRPHAGQRSHLEPHESRLVIDGGLITTIGPSREPQTDHRPTHC